MLPKPQTELEKLKKKKIYIQSVVLPIMQCWTRIPSCTCIKSQLNSFLTADKSTPVHHVSVSINGKKRVNVSSVFPSTLV